MSDILISVIVSAYNVEEYIEDVLNDIRDQTYRNLEIIVVDDGSTDNTLSIIRNIAMIDKRIRFTCINNSGVSKARNIGLEMATGEFVRFIDGDDRMPRDSIERMFFPYSIYEDIDLVIGNYICIPARNYITGIEFDSEVVGQEKFVMLFAKYVKSYYFGVTWNKLYRRSIIEQYQLIFDERLPWCEDFVFNVDYYSKCSSFYLLNVHSGIYDYYMREGSVTKINEGRCRDERDEYISNIRYKKMIEYCKRYCDEDVLTLEWKYAELINILSDISSVKNRGKSYWERYKEFKQMLQLEEVFRYVSMKENNDKSIVWRTLKKAIERKSYLRVYTLFWGKGIVKTYPLFNNKWIRERFRFLFPKSF